MSAIGGLEQPRAARPLARGCLLPLRALRLWAAADDHGRALPDLAPEDLGGAAVRDPEAQRAPLRPPPLGEDVDGAGRAPLRIGRGAAAAEVARDRLELRPALRVEGGRDLVVEGA